jgi:hypothetical protein
MSRRLFWLWSIFLLAGCWSGTQPLVPVSGTIYYLGQPVRSGVIVFTPDASHGSRGPIAHGKIQADGSYVLATGEQSGAVVGWHRVTVLSQAATQPQVAGPPYSIPRSLVPEKYRSPDLSGLAYEVKAGQENVFHIDLQ